MNICKPLLVRRFMSITALPKLRDTHLLFTECAQIPVTSQTSVLRPSQKRLTHVPDVCPPPVAITNDSRPRRLSSDHHRN